MYRCPCCDSHVFGFSSALRERIENKKADQSTSIYSISIDCCKCGETLAENEFVVTKRFGEKVDGEEVYELGKRYLEDWKREHNGQSMRELNAFNNCPHCRTSMYVSFEKRVHFYENGTSDPVYRVVCHGCDREAAMGLTAQSATGKWNRTFPMEE